MSLNQTRKMSARGIFICIAVCFGLFAIVLDGLAAPIFTVDSAGIWRGSRYPDTGSGADYEIVSENLFQAIGPASVLQCTGADLACFRNPGTLQTIEAFGGVSDALEFPELVFPFFGPVFGQAKINPVANGVTMATGLNAPLEGTPPGASVVMTATGTVSGSGSVGVVEHVEGLINNSGPVGVPGTIYDAIGVYLVINNSSDGEAYEFILAGGAKAPQLSATTIDINVFINAPEDTGCFDSQVIREAGVVSETGLYALYGAGKCDLDVGLGSTFEMTSIVTADFATLDPLDALSIFPDALTASELPEFGIFSAEVPVEPLSFQCPAGAQCISRTVPEPSTLVAFWIGLLGLGFLRYGRPA